jgi:hypothetical protein
MHTKIEMSIGACVKNCDGSIVRQGDREEICTIVQHVCVCLAVQTTLVPAARECVIQNGLSDKVSCLQRRHAPQTLYGLAIGRP